MELLPYRIDRHVPDEYGRTYIDIFIIDGATNRSIMTVYLEQAKQKNRRPLDKINISYVEKYDKTLKGCFREYMKILVSKTTKIFRHELKKTAEVVLIVSPQMPSLLEESFAITELKKLYGKSGFKNYDPQNTMFMVSTINKLTKVLEGKDKLDDPFRTPNESIYYGSPTTPEKEKNMAVISQTEPIPLRYTKEIPNYLKTTESSRRKTRNKRTPQVHQSKGGKRSPQVTPSNHRRCTKRKTMKRR
jgi:hypothetical protein